MNQTPSQNPLVRVGSFKQSVWIDFIQRDMFPSGRLQSLIDNDGVVGLTSNPSIFKNAISGSEQYANAIQNAIRRGKSAKEIYEGLAVDDIQRAADLFRPTYQKTDFVDGLVSIEVSPLVAHDTKQTVEEARRLWKEVSKPNVLIKVPATKEGLVAIEQLIGEGINVNATLLFGTRRYAEVIEAYLSGLESRIRQSLPIGHISSVASFFLSRIDVEIDRLLPETSDIRGKTAIACAKAAYQKYEFFFKSDRFKKIQEQGGRTQRLLWASTSTKAPNESDIKYVEALVGPDTIDTIPLKTLNAYRDHGDPRQRLTEDSKSAFLLLEKLSEAGISLDAVEKTLEDEGVQKFSNAYEDILASLEIKRSQPITRNLNEVSIEVANCEKQVADQIASLRLTDAVGRIWRQDASLWKPGKEEQRQIEHSLEWLHLVEKMSFVSPQINDFVAEIRKAGFAHVVLMGMGGSSLAARVFARTFSDQGGLRLQVLDSTSPDAVQAIESSVTIDKTLFIVASKSGSTAEPIAFTDYFFERVKRIKGDQAGDQFIAITDPETPLVELSKKLKFRRVFLNNPDVGGRYSALSYFGLLPAALMGVRLDLILQAGLSSERKSHSNDSELNSPSLVLGAFLGEMAKRGQTMITLLVDKQVQALGLWIEQLLAESTGKENKGLVPVSNEPIGHIDNYGKNRAFVYLQVRDGTLNAEQESLEAFVSDLKAAGRPVITVKLGDRLDVGYQFFQWEFATAIAGAMMGINPFDQPNVQESKDNTNRLLSQQGSQRSLEKPKFIENSLRIFTTVDGASAKSSLANFLGLAFPGDYVALQAFLPESPEIHKGLQSLRAKLRDRLKLATTLGYGPRFLHSTGQLHKGGPSTGIFIQLTADHMSDSLIPGRDYTFGDFQDAQAEGDLEALRRHGRRVIRIHLCRDITGGLRELESLIAQALI